MKAFFLPLLLLVGLSRLSPAQAPVTVHGRVVDRDGLGVAQATVTLRSAAEIQTTLSDKSGGFSVSMPSAFNSVTLSAALGPMVSRAVQIAAGDLSAPIVLTLAPSSVQQEVNVVATRSGIEVGPTARTISLLTEEELEQYPALTLDERLRQHAGFELFRRSSGWIQNPTSQGITLRGLGSTAASRTLVLADGAPLNDPFGGWIHWNEIPPEAIDAVTIAAGGGSDLYGSSALGGVIDVLPGKPESTLGAISVSGAGQGTASGSGRSDIRQGKWGELVAGQYFRTDGYILTAPASRGPVDVPANVHFETARIDLSHTIGQSGRAFLTGNVLNEARDNGTLIQTNATRLWRYLAGDNWSAGPRLDGRVRLFGSDENYRQSFSAITGGPARTGESLTRLQHVGTQELGTAADTAYHLLHVSFIGGVDVRDIRATDLETPIKAGSPNGLQDTTVRQRFIGGFGEALAEHGPWSGTVSLRADRAENLDSSTIAIAAGATTNTAVADRSEVVLSPRIGLMRRLGSQVDVHASAFRAFRTPTMNELYRTGQVGQQTTLANSGLVSERATGAEGGVAWHPNLHAAVNATYFWTEINRPVSALFISSTATSLTNKRENLGQIQSQGVELDARINEGHALSAAVGYQYAHAVVTNFSAQPALVGKWIPEVPRQSATAQLRGENRRLGALTIALRESGRAYDDSSNTFLLHGFFTMDLYAERSFAKGWTAFVAGQNMLDRQVDVSRTPVLTTGTPFTAQGGVRFRWGGSELK